MKWSIKHKSGRVLFVTSDEFIAENRRKMGWIVEEVKMTSREQFDAAYEEMQHDRFGNNRDWAWKFWQASRAAIEVQLPLRVGAKSSWQDGPNMFADEVIEAVESQGLKVKK